MNSSDPAQATGNADGPPDKPLPPLRSPMPRSDILDREEPEFVDEPDLPAPSSDDEPASAAGEEDPGADVDVIDPVSPKTRGR